MEQNKSKAPQKKKLSARSERPEMTDESAAAYRAKLVANGTLTENTEELRYDEFGLLCMSASQVKAKRARMITSGEIKPNPNYRPQDRRAPRVIRIGGKHA